MQEKEKFLRRQGGGHNFVYKFIFTEDFRNLSMRLFPFLIKQNTSAHSLRVGTLVLADTGFRCAAGDGPTFLCL